ncbi:phage major capsid protein [Paludisphaera soli]|uniref:phage major capsid protein n=1 Tax=Paludisphaera soli TaxID=2712865 RepID=UPI0013EB599B|nr:phage major capsid protein [Paludisphaera soli]
MTLAQMRAAAAEARRRALELRSEYQAAEAPTPEMRAAVDEAGATALRLLNEADAEEQRSRLFADLESRGSANFVNRSIADGRDAHGGERGQEAEWRSLVSRFSIRRALWGAAELRENRPFDGVEFEVSQELRRNSVALRSRPGVSIPWDAPVSRRMFPRGYDFSRVEYRDLTTTTGASTIPTLVMPTMIDLLRARLVLTELGAQVLTGITQPFNLSRQNATATIAWVGEQGSATASNLGTDDVQFRAKTVTANTIISRKFLYQTNMSDGETFAVDDLMKAVQQGVERAAINGSGSSNQPRGVLQTSGVGSVATAGANGGPITWALLNAMIGKVNNANAPDNARGWLTNPDVRTKMASTPREAGYPKYIWDADSRDEPIASYRAMTTTNVPNNLVKGTSGTTLSAMIFADWSELVVALMSQLDILADPFSLAHTGDIRYAIFQDVDINVRHPGSFCICSDISTV